MSQVDLHSPLAASSIAAATASEQASKSLPVLQNRDAEPLMPVRAPISPWVYLGFGFVALALIVLVSTHGTGAGGTLSVSFVSIILEALPFVMLGSLMGGLFEVFVPRETVIRLLPKHKLPAILVAGLLGVCLPVCECAVIPFTRRIVRKGVPFSTAVAYLLAGPIVNVLVGSATLMAYGWNWHIMAARMIFGYAVAVTVALIVDRLYPGHSALSDPTMEATAACGCGHEHGDAHGHNHSHAGPHRHDTVVPAAHSNIHDHDHNHDNDHVHAEAELSFSHAHAHEHSHNHTHDHSHDHDHDTLMPRPLWPRFAEAINHAGDDFLQVGQFLVLGAFVASICQTLIPRHAFLSISAMPPLAIATMMGLAIVLNLCSGADAFVASSFRSVLPLSAQMGFMVLGPMLDLKLSAMYLSFIKKKAFLTLVVLMYTSVFVLMLGWHYLFVGAAH